MAYPSPVSCDLPEFRVNGGCAFKTSGVDFCGPVFVKEMSGKMSKAYIALFTCATSRMIHLELTPDISTRSQRRFIG